MQNPSMFISVNKEDLYMVFIDHRFNYKDVACGIDDTKDDLMMQVENCAKKLKRADIQRIALVRIVMDENDENLILKIVRLFEEEEIDVACVYSNKFSPFQYDVLNQKLEYGIVNDWSIMEKKNENNEMSYRKSL